MHSYFLFGIFLTLFNIVGVRANTIGEKESLLIGKVVDEDSGQALEYATVSAFKGEALISGTITDASGSFKLGLPEGIYQVVIEFIAYQTHTLESILIDGTKSQIDLGSVSLIPNARILEEVEVVGEKSQFQLSLDKKIYNVGKDINSRSGSADNLLDNIPSVSVDLEGNVSLRGSDNVRILIDGRPSGTGSVRGVNLLKTIQANQIDRVEIITNPSAKYEAEGTSGILNIILKKNKNSGLNGSFDVLVGQPELAGIGINMNYRKGKINWFSNLGFRYQKVPGEGFRDQRFTDGREPFRSLQNREHDRGGKSSSLKFGLDFHLSPSDIITTYFEGELADEDNDAMLTYRDFFTPNTSTTLSIRTDIEKEDESEIEYLLGYKHIFGGDEKHNLSADFQYRNSTEEESSDFLNQIFDNTASVVEIETRQRSENDEGERIFLFKADYTYPFSKEGKIEAGYRANIRTVDNNFLVQDFNDNGEWITLEEFNNELEYKENIHSIYSSIGNKINKFSFLGGIRLEHSDITTNLLITNEINPRTYTDLFPSLFFSYELDKKNSVQISYSRRIRRPRFFELNPFLTFSDNRNVFRGNPNLDPEYTNSFEAGHIAYLENFTLTSSIYFRHTTDVIQRLISVNNDLTTTIQPENIATNDAYGIEFTLSTEPVKNWKINADINLFGFDLSGQFQEQIFDTQDFTYMGRLTNQIKLNNLFDIQLRTRYRGPTETAQGTRKAISVFDLGISRDILNKKGTLTLNASDIFNTRRRRSTTFGDGFNIDSEFQWRSRQISFTFNYRLNRKKSRGGNRSSNDGGGEF